MIGRTLAAALAIALSVSAAHAQSQHRLPNGYQWGRCLLIVSGQTRISGRCSYEIDKGGEFMINGPRQVYGSRDVFGDSSISADQISTDYWARVFKDGNSWTGYGNATIGSVHGEGGDWGELRREGACYVGKDVRVCLWR